MSNLKQQIAPVSQLQQWDASNQSCLAGLYLLTNEGTLARFDSTGAVVLEPDLSAKLAFRLRAVLNQYRSGAVEDLTIGLVVDPGLDLRWGTGTMVFGDRLLNELFDAGRVAGMPLTLYERSNKTKTIVQGMELVLNKRKLHRSSAQYFCPVLFIPEVDNMILCERYGVDFVNDQGLYEVLDLAAPFASNKQLPDELLDMVRHMHRTQAEIAAASRRRLYQEDPMDEHGFESASPMLSMLPGDVDPGTDTCFKEGDAVTGWLLEWFSPFNELTDTQRDIVAGYEAIRKVKAGTRLVEQGSNEDACIYLVEGTLDLEGADGRSMRITGGTRRSRLPISVLTPHAYTITAVTDASFIVFSQKLIRMITEITRTYSTVDPGFEVESSTTAISNGMQAAYLNSTSTAFRTEDR